MHPIIVGASVQGESHKRRDIERQDSFLIIENTVVNNRKSRFYKKLTDDIKIIAVADGHGSASCPYSSKGSEIAARVFCDIMAEIASGYKDKMRELFLFLNKEGETVRIAKTIVKEWELRIEQSNIAYDHEVTDNVQDIWKKYGTTLLGLLITSEFIFAFQLGDGDITFVDTNTVAPVIEGDKILGVETHSISKASSWKKVHTHVIDIDSLSNSPFMICVSTDGWVNSHASEDDFHKTCKDYFNIIQEHGMDVIENNLEPWLSETSAMGCGDDITVVFAYFIKE